MILGLLNEARISIAASRLRTFLAMLGIVIGVGSVVLMIAIGNGSKQSVEDAISQLGSNLLIVSPGGKEVNGLRSADHSDLDIKDAAAIALLPNVVAAAPVTPGFNLQIASGKLNWNTRVTGTIPSFFAIRNWSFSSGDAFNAEDLRLGRRVAVIGATLVEKLFNGENPMGRTIRINNMPFQIAGVLEAKGQGFDGRDQDDAVFVPISTAKSKLLGNNYVQGIVQLIFVEAASKEVMDDAVEEITTLLRQRHNLAENVSDNFTVHNLTAITDVASEAANAFSLLLGAIASISLVVGGIGIMNIMLVTVSERTREIGIRKAIGATETHIMLQFLFEAILIAAVGSGTGLVIGVGLGMLAHDIASIPVEYNIWTAVLALSVAVVVGILSGLYPARKAAKLEPIEALRVAGA